MRERVWRSMKDLRVLLFFIEHDWLSCERMVNVRPEMYQKCSQSCDNVPFFFFVKYVCPVSVLPVVSISVLTGAWGEKPKTIGS